MNTEQPIHIRPTQISKSGIEITVPQIRGLSNDKFQETCNRLILTLTQQMMKVQVKSLPSSSFEMTGSYKQTLNTNGLLSLCMMNHIKNKDFSSTFSIFKSITLNVRSGKFYDLPELFLPKQDYRFPISKNIQQQIKARGIPLLQPFHLIHPNQEFYLTEHLLVIHFPMFELAKADHGILTFPIDLTTLKGIADLQGPIGVLVADL